MSLLNVNNALNGIYSMFLDNAVDVIVDNIDFEYDRDGTVINRALEPESCVKALVDLEPNTKNLGAFVQDDTKAYVTFKLMTSDVAQDERLKTYRVRYLGIEYHVIGSVPLHRGKQIVMYTLICSREL